MLSLAMRAATSSHGVQTRPIIRPRELRKKRMSPNAALEAQVGSQRQHLRQPRHLHLFLLPLLPH
jgi:hypothetical protein